MIFFFIVVMERHSQELPPSSKQSDLSNPTTELVGAVGRENQMLVVRKQPLLFGTTSQDLLNPQIQLQHVIIVVSNLDVIQRYMEHLTFLIILKGCVLNIHLLPLMTPTKQLSPLKVVTITVSLQHPKSIMLKLVERPLLCLLLWMKNHSRWWRVGVLRSCADKYNLCLLSHQDSP